MKSIMAGFSPSAPAKTNPIKPNFRRPNSPPVRRIAPCRTIFGGNHAGLYRHPALGQDGVENGGGFSGDMVESKYMNNSVNLCKSVSKNRIRQFENVSWLSPIGDLT